MTTPATAAPPAAPAVSPQGTAAPAAAPAPAETPAAALPEDLAKLVQNPEAFKARLAEERKAAQARLLKDLGMEKVDDLRALVDSHRTAEEARKGREKVLEEKVQTLTTQASRVESLEGAVRRLLAAEEAAIPEARKGVLDLAPPAEDPVGRLDWITRAKAQGLLAATPPATLAGGGARTPPAPAPSQSGGKDPRNMTAQEWQEHRATWALRHAQGGGT